ncbi:MAG: LamG-like jellyroll fold domain-containing protein, partial [bacterium]|nr:LamG-like jellyroll fold domain-containing protein [bacterium]
DQADAIATRTEFVWDGNGYSFYLGSDVISSSTDPDIIDLVGFGPAALYYEGNGPAPEIPDAYILSRLTNTHNNSTDFNLIASDDPNAVSPEPIVNLDLFFPPVPAISAGLTDIWHFNECYGEGTWAVGKWDCARQFGNRGEQPLNVSLDPAVNLNNGFSLSFYYKKSLDVPSIKTILSNATGERFSIRTDASMLEIEGLPDSEFRYYQGIPNDYKWHKLTLVINQAAGHWEVYIDSLLVVQEFFWQRLPVMTDLEIKSESIAVLFDELALWNRPLTALEIKTDYETDAPYSPMPVREAQTAAELLHFWSFEEDIGLTALDSVGGAVLNLAANAWTSRGPDNYAIKSITGRPHSGALENFPETKDLSMAFWWRDRSDPYNGQADIYLTGGANNEKNLFAILADNYRLDYWFNNSYGILVEGLNKAIPGGCDWHYLTYVYDSYRYKLNFYVDGEEKASTSLIWMPDGEKVRGIKIMTNGEKAEIDSLSLWKGALSPRQVRELYANN